jgi:hypothetical protein
MGFETTRASALQAVTRKFNFVLRTATPICMEYGVIRTANDLIKPSAAFRQ